MTEAYEEPFVAPAIDEQVESSADAPLPLTLAQQELVEKNMGLVRYAAALTKRKYPSIDYEEAVLDGYEGLCHAARRYNPVMGEFQSYAPFRIRGQIIDGLRRMSKIDDNNQATVVSLLNNTNAVSLDIPVGEDGSTTTLSDIIASHAPTPEEVYLEKEELTWLEEQVKALPARTRMVVIAYLLGMAFTEISTEMAVSKTRVGQIYDAGVEEIKTRNGIDTPVQKDRSLEERITEYLLSCADYTFSADNAILQALSRAIDARHSQVGGISGTLKKMEEKGILLRSHVIGSRQRSIQLVGIGKEELTPPISELDQKISDLEDEMLSHQTAVDLSKKQTEVLECMASGLSSREIGLQLYNSGDTIRTHRNFLFQKLGVTNSALAVRLGIENGLLKVEPAKETAPYLRPSEIEVLRLSSLGLTNKEVGAFCGRSPLTIKTQKAPLLTKLRANNTPHAVRRAYELGIFVPRHSETSTEEV